MRRTAAAAAALLAVGCIAEPPPRDSYHRLRVEAPAPRAEPLLPGAVEVERPAASPVLHTRAVVIAEGEDDLVLRQHAYHYWTDAPPVMVQERLAAWLRRTGAAERVALPQHRSRPDWRVTGKLHRFERVLGGGPPAVAVELELLLRRHGDGRVLVHETYSVERPAGGDGVRAGASALGDALETVFARFLADAERALAEAPAP